MLRPTYELHVDEESMPVDGAASHGELDTNNTINNTLSRIDIEKCHSYSNTLVRPMPTSPNLSAAGLSDTEESREWQLHSASLEPTHLTDITLRYDDAKGSRTDIITPPDNGSCDLTNREFALSTRTECALPTSSTDKCLNYCTGDTIYFCSRVGLVTASVISVLGSTFSNVVLCCVVETPERSSYWIGQKIVVKVFDFTKATSLRELFHLTVFTPEQQMCLQHLLSRSCLSDFTHSLVRMHDILGLGSAALGTLYQTDHCDRELPELQILLLAIESDTVYAELRSSGFLSSMSSGTREGLAWFYAIIIYFSEVKTFDHLNQLDFEDVMTPRFIDSVDMEWKDDPTRPLGFPPTPAIVMEFVEGQSIAEYTDVEDDMLRCERIARVITACSLTIVAAWRRGIQHSDLHLENFVVVEDRQTSEVSVRIVDVGSFQPVKSSPSHLAQIQRSGHIFSSSTLTTSLVKNGLLSACALYPGSQTAYDPYLEMGVHDSVMAQSGQCSVDLDNPCDPLLITALFDRQYDELATYQCSLIHENICYSANLQPKPLSDRGLHWLLRLVSSVISQSTQSLKLANWAECILVFIFSQFTSMTAAELLQRFRSSLPPSKPMKSCRDWPIDVSNVTSAFEVVTQRPICVHPDWTNIEVVASKDWQHQQQELRHLIASFCRCYTVEAE